MGRQRSTSYMKEQKKTTEEEFTKMETSNIPDAEFKRLVIKMFFELCICELLDDSYQVDLEVHSLRLNLVYSWTPPRSVSRGPMAHLLHKATLLRLGDLRALPNT